jgi:hypothetical protein
MQDLFQNYVSDLNKFRDAFHDELVATAQDLSKAIETYAQQGEAALASFMDKVLARGVELDETSAARLNQFRGLPANGGLEDVDDGPRARSPANAADEVRIAAVAERAVADGLHVENEGDHKPQSGRTATLVKSGSVV